MPPLNSNVLSVPPRLCVQSSNFTAVQLSGKALGCPSFQALDKKHPWAEFAPEVEQLSTALIRALRSEGVLTALSEQTQRDVSKATGVEVDRRRAKESAKGMCRCLVTFLAPYARMNVDVSVDISAKVAATEKLHHISCLCDTAHRGQNRSPVLARAESACRRCFGA